MAGPIFAAQRLGHTAPNKRRNDGEPWRLCDDLIGPEIEAHKSRTDSVRLATELTGRYNATQVCSKIILLVSHFKQAGKSCSTFKQ